MLPFCIKTQYIVVIKELKHNLFKLGKLWATTWYTVEPPKVQQCFYI